MFVDVERRAAKASIFSSSCLDSAHAMFPSHPRQMEPEEKYRDEVTVADVNLIDWNDGDHVGRSALLNRIKCTATISK